MNVYDVYLELLKRLRQLLDFLRVFSRDRFQLNEKCAVPHVTLLPNNMHNAQSIPGVHILGTKAEW